MIQHFLKKKTKEEPSKPKKEKAIVQEENRPKQDLVAVEKPIGQSILAVFTDDKGQKSFRAFFYVLAILALLVLGLLMYVRHQKKKNMMNSIQKKIEEMRQRIGKL